MATEIDRYLRQDPRTNTKDYSKSFLVRELAKNNLLELLASNVSRWMLITLTMIPIIALTTKSGVASDVNTLVSFMTYYFGFSLFYITALLSGKRMSFLRRRAQYYPTTSTVKPRRTAMSDLWPLPTVGLIFGSMIALGTIGMNPAEVRATLVASLGLLLWAAIIVTASSPLRDNRLVIWLAPDTALVTALANSFAEVVLAAPTQWRTLEHRLLIAAEISSAAAIIEGSLFRKLARSGASPIAPKSLNLAQAAMALRALSASAIVGGPESRATLRTELGRALAAASSGNLDALPTLELPGSAAGEPSRLARTLHAIKGLVLALAPAITIGVILVVGESRGWSIAAEPATRTVLVQFAALWLLVGVMAALDPTGYQQKLGAVTGTGTPLFGWGRTRT